MTLVNEYKKKVLEALLENRNSGQSLDATMGNIAVRTDSLRKLTRAGNLKTNSARNTAPALPTAAENKFFETLENLGKECKVNVVDLIGNEACEGIRESTGLNRQLGEYFSEVKKDPNFELSNMQISMLKRSINQAKEELKKKL